MADTSKLNGVVKRGQGLIQEAGQASRTGRLFRSPAAILRPPAPGECSYLGQGVLLGVRDYEPVSNNSEPRQKVAA